MNKLVIIGIVSAVIIGSGMAYFKFTGTENRTEPVSYETKTQNELVLENIEKEIYSIASGGIHPNEYARIDKELRKLEDQEFEPDRTHAIRAALDKLRTYSPKSPPQPTVKATSPAPKKQSNKLDQLFSNSKCQGSGSAPFTASPMRPQDVGLIIPLGSMVGGHVTPVDHQYFYPIGWNAGGADVPIFSPADGVIVSVFRYLSTRNIEGLESKDGYDMIIEHSCTFYTKLGLLTGISGEIAKQVGSVEPGREKDVRVPVKAGQQVALVGGQSLDLFTFDLHTPPKQWIVPGHYNDSDGLKIYITDPFLYFTESIKTALLTKNPRTVEPRGGRFDYDIDGRLVGTWFLKGTNGYTGNDPTAQGYWRGHLVFAYNAVDPSSVEVSLGSWGGSTNGFQFAVKNNTPDPKDVSVSSGIITYELTDDYFVKPDGGIWSRDAYAGPVRRYPSKNARGVILVQMINDRLIKVEKFPGKDAGQVNGFSPAAELYER